MEHALKRAGPWPLPLHRLIRGVRAVAAHQRACIAGFALLPILIRLALLPWIPIPQPAIQDEFSYLLAADTFASGRLTNPPHPLWVFFESVHIIQQPTYMTKYPPLTGLILAAGQRVFGHPWFGVLLSMGVLSGLLAWALLGWLPPLWAFAGAWLAVLKIGLLSYWGESYWGGAGAAIGGALLVGSVPRLYRRDRLRYGLSAAIGIALLALSRPFEGLLLTVLCAVYLCWRFLRDCRYRFGARTFALRFALPVAAVMIPAGAWTLLYNYRVTGDALLMPYMVHERQYAAAAPFFWQKTPPTPVYRHEALKREWVDWDLSRKTLQRRHFVLAHLQSSLGTAAFFWGVPLLVLIIAALQGLAKSGRTRAALWLGILFAAGLCCELEFIPHYAAPAAALAYIVAAGALRSLHHRYQRRWGWSITVLVFVALSLQFTVELFMPAHRFLYDKRDFQQERARILRRLEQAPGKQLVFVQYGPGHDINHEWVYNRADIDRSRIVWAREMGPDRDQELLDYYRDRHVWKLVDSGEARGVDLSPIAPTERAKR